MIFLLKELSADFVLNTRSLIVVYVSENKKRFHQNKDFKNWGCLFIKLKNGDAMFFFIKTHFSNLFKAKSLFSFRARWDQIKMKQKWNDTSRQLRV